MEQLRKCMLACFLFFFFATGGFAQKNPYTLPKTSPDKIKADLILLKKILEANHPSLYWFTPKDSIDYFFAAAINSITDSLDEVQCKNKMEWVVSKIRCGHTSVRFSKAYSKVAVKFRYPQFPLLIKTWSDSFVVAASFRRNDSVFKRGTVITSINGRTPKQIVDTVFQFMSADGYGINHKYQSLSNNFPGWYKTVLGIDSSYSITYIDASGEEANAVIKNFNPLQRDSLERKRPVTVPLTAFKKPTRKEIRKAQLLAKRSMLIDTSLHTAVFRITTFTGGGLRRFFRRSFKTIHEQQVQRIVIDLHENGGGRVNNSILLAKYLADHPFKISDSVVAISRKLEYGNYIKPWLPYWFAMNFGTHKEKDGSIHLRYYEHRLFEPKEKFHFNGDVYLLQGGLSFSATTLFISSLKGQNNVTTVGEETGGGYYGNSAMFLPTIKLPNTGLQVSLPLFRLVMDSNRPKGFGIMPDIAVGPTAIGIKNGSDLKLQVIKQLIQQKEHAAALK